MRSERSRRRVIRKPNLAQIFEAEASVRNHAVPLRRCPICNVNEAIVEINIGPFAVAKICDQCGRAFLGVGNLLGKFIK